jgi:hypothetical protein
MVRIDSCSIISVFGQQFETNTNESGFCTRTHVGGCFYHHSLCFEIRIKRGEEMNLFIYHSVHESRVINGRWQKHPHPCGCTKVFPLTFIKNRCKMVNDSKSRLVWRHKALVAISTKLVLTFGRAPKLFGSIELHGQIYTWALLRQARFLWFFFCICLICFVKGQPHHFVSV